jgi:hypothetical protein
MIKPTVTTPTQTFSHTPQTAVVPAASPQLEKAPANPSDRSDVSFPTPAAITSSSPPATVTSGSAPAGDLSPSPPERAPVKDSAPKGPDVVTSLEDHTPEVLKGFKAESVISARDGELLSKGKFLKLDYFPQVVNTALKEKIEGAPNFRQVKDTNVYGVAQPTVQGIRNVLDRAGAKDKTVMWTNMREEPVLYINGRSVSLRDIKVPFENAHDTKASTAKRWRPPKKT